MRHGGGGDVRREEKQDGKTVRVLTFRCRNKRCEDHGRTVGERLFDKS